MFADPAIQARPSGYSLNEAARIRGAVLAEGGSATCPRCGDTLSRTVGQNLEGGVWMLRCVRCARSLVIVESTARL